MFCLHRGKITNMVAVKKLFCKKSSRWQVAAIKVLIKNKSQVKKFCGATKQLLTKSGLMMKTTKVFSTTQKLIQCPLYYLCNGCLYCSSRHKRFKRHCEGSIHKKNFHLYGCNLPLIISFLRKIQTQKNLLD